MMNIGVKQISAFVAMYNTIICFMFQTFQCHPCRVLDPSQAPAPT